MIYDYCIVGAGPIGLLFGFSDLLEIIQAFVVNNIN